MKPNCLIFGHKWKTDYVYDGNDSGSKTHTCARCGLTREHKWERVEHKCNEKCVKCGITRFNIPHRFVEESPCRFVCEICGHKKEMHTYKKESECVKVCSKCGRTETAHQWDAIAKPDDWRGVSFWSVGLQKEIRPCDLPTKLQGCYCERCLEPNPDGLHMCIITWETDGNGVSNSVTKCRHCGTVCEKLTGEQRSKREREQEIRRYEQDANADEGIFH